MNSTSSRERLEAIVSWSGLNINAIAREIGLPRADTLYNIRNEVHGLTPRIAERLKLTFPTLSMAWLMQGHGAMFESVEPRGRDIPLYEAGAINLLYNTPAENPTNYIMLPTPTECDIAIRYNNDTMGESIPRGSILLLKKCSLNDIIPQCEYLLLSKNVVTLRMVTPEGDMLHLSHPLSPLYGEVTVPRSEVTGVYRVVGKIIYN